MPETNLNNNFNKDKKKKKIQYSLLTIVLIICIIELFVSSMQNINKNINFVSKIKGLENKRDEEYDKNRQLKSEIENFNSEQILESIARNNLKMAGQNEILIIINKPKTIDNEEELKVNNKMKHKKNRK